MNNRAAIAVMLVFLLVALCFGSPAPSSADASPDELVAVDGGR